MYAVHRLWNSDLLNDGRILPAALRRDPAMAGGIGDAVRLAPVGGMIPAAGNVMGGFGIVDASLRMIPNVFGGLLEFCSGNAEAVAVYQSRQSYVPRGDRARFARWRMR